MDTSLTHPSEDRLALLCRVSQTFNSSLDLDEVLNRVMDEVIAAVQAERGFLMLREPDGRLVFRVARGMDHETIDDPQFQVSRSVVERVAHEGKPVLTSDAQADDRFRMRASIMSLGLRSILCVPLALKDTILGVVYVDNRLQRGLFVQDDLELLSAIASSAAVAIENARLYRVAVEKGRMERELQMAREVQNSLLPRETPQVPGWEFATRWRPAHEVAGDYYDFIPGHGGQLGVVIGDVSDKGMHSALFMAVTRSIVRASVSHASAPVEGIVNANRLIWDDSMGSMFVTLFYALLRPEVGVITYVNAGHNPPLLYRQSSAEEETLTQLMPTGVALGILEGFPYEERTVRLEPGDFVVLYTDGVTDATRVDRQRFGTDRLRRVVLENTLASAAEMVTAVENAVGEFAGSAPQFDDMAILVAKRLSSG
jgi:sigma-B regulation protein RsbU (phosphoserine phosphatase)